MILLFFEGGGGAVGFSYAFPIEVGNFPIVWPPTRVDVAAMVTSVETANNQTDAAVAAMVTSVETANNQTDAELAMPIVWKKGDRLPSIVATLKKPDGTIQDLTSATGVTFVYYPAGGGASKGGACTILSPATNGQVQYDPVSADTDTVGQFFGEFVVTFTGGKTERFPNDRMVEVQVVAIVP